MAWKWRFFNLLMNFDVNRRSLLRFLIWLIRTTEGLRPNRNIGIMEDWDEGFREKKIGYDFSAFKTYYYIIPKFLSSM